MPFGRRLGRLFGGASEAGGDPDSLTEAGVVLLAEGPLTVERLRDAGIQATSIETVDPVTAARTTARILVRRADLAAARQVLADRGADASAALDDLAAGDGADGEEDWDEGAEEEAQQLMSELFLAADRLSTRPGDVRSVAEVAELRSAVAESPPPFGVEHLAWGRVAQLAGAVVDADDEGDTEGVRSAAMALRDFLHRYV